MIREFCFADPEQLKEANVFAKSGDCRTLATVWSVSKRQGRTTLDGRIFARFETQGNTRTAFIYRCAGGEQKEICGLKYTPALKWCNENLEMPTFIPYMRK